MHPAPSVILFTVLSGLGFGMLAWLGLGMPAVTGWVAFGYFFIAYALAVGGLLASLLHLGNPQRFLKAFLQWRSSWLSREAWLSVSSLCVMGLFALGAIFFGGGWSLLGWLGAVLSLVTVYCTSMIYTSLKTVPRWNHPSTPVLFVLLSVAGGALLTGQIIASVPLLVLAGACQLLVWHRGDKSFAERGSSIASATGLTGGDVRLFEGPHTGTSYLTREMVFQVGRKHVRVLRIIAILCMSILPAALLTLFHAGYVVVILAAALHIIGVFAARWLFFAQAEHVVSHYYGR